MNFKDLKWLIIEKQTLDKEIKDLENSIDYGLYGIDTERERVKGGKYDDKVYKLIENNKKIQKKLIKRSLECGKLKLEIEKAIAQIEPAEIRVIFEMRYKNNMTLEDIGNKVGYTKMRICQILNEQ